MYYTIFGKHVITNDLAMPSYSIANAGVNLTDYTPNDTVYNYPEGILNVVSSHCYHAGMAAKEHPEWNLTDPNRDTGIYDPSSEYADVVYYFGPELNEQGKAVRIVELKSGGTQQLYTVSGSTATLFSAAIPSGTLNAEGEALTRTGRYTVLTNSNGGAISKTLGTDEEPVTYYAVGQNDSTYYYVSGEDYKLDMTSNSLSNITRADVERIFAEKLRPGDIIAVMLISDEGEDSPDGGHDMMYLGDVDGDDVGEIIHSWGAKYNNNYARTGDSKKRYITQDTFDAATTRDSYTVSGETVEFTYGSEQAYAASSGDTTNFLKGYDLRDGAKSWYASTGAYGNNYTGGAGTGFLGRNGGGSITIEDWTIRLGYRKSFSSDSSKVNKSGTYGSNYFMLSSSGNSGTYYFGNDGSGQSSTPYQFAILRPINKESFAATISPSAQARQTLPDLGVTKTAAVNPYQTVANGDTITYTIELVGNKARGTVAAGRTTTTVADFNTTVDPTETYFVNVTETLPSGATFVSCTGDGSKSGDKVTWSSVSVADGETKTLSYTVRVTAGRGGKVESPKGKVWNAEDPLGYFSTSAITHLVGGTPLSASAITPSVSSTGSGTDIAKDVYQEAYGIDLELPETAVLFNSLLETDYWAAESSGYRDKYRPRNASALSGDALTLRNMVVQNYIGGKRVVTYDENGIKTNLNRLRDFSMEFLRVGDILVYANRDSATGLLQADGSDGDTYVYVYLGNNKFAYYDTTGVYQTVTAPLKSVQYSDTSAHFLYSKVVTQAFLKDAFVLLRPTQAVDDLASTGCTLTDLQPEATMEVSTDGGATYGEPVEYAAFSAACNVQYAETVAAAKAEVEPNTYRITLLDDVSITSEVKLEGDVTVDLDGHTLTASGQASLDFLGQNSNGNGYSGEAYLKNGTVIGDYLAVNLNNSEYLTIDNCEIYANDMHGVSWRPSTTGNYFWGFAVAKSSGSRLYLNDCVLGTLGNEKPLYCKSPDGDQYDNGANGNTTNDNTVYIQDNVTIYVPTTFNEGENRHSGWDKEGRYMTFDPAGVMRTVTTETVTLPVAGATEKEYSVVRFSTDAAAIGGTTYATLDTALAAAEAAGTPQTVTLLNDLSLTSNVTVPAGVTVNPGGHTLTGGKLYLAPGATYDTVTVPTGANEVSLGNQTYVAFLPEPGMTVQQSLSLTDTIVLNAAVDDGGYTNYYAWMRWTEGGTAHAEVVTGHAKDGMIYFPLVGKKAKNMGDLHDVTIFGVDGAGEAHIARSTTLSIRDYADTVLDGLVDWDHDETADAQEGKYGADLGRAMTAMLQYGAAAQTYFGYETDSLVSANLTQEMKDRVAAKYGADALAAARSETISGVAGETGLVYGVSSILGESMALKFYFRLPPAEWTDEALAAVTVTTAFTDRLGVKHEKAFPATALERNANENYRSCTVDTLTAADVAAQVTVTLTRGDEQLVQAFDSVANYTGRAAGRGMTALADPMLIYGLAARDYFPYVIPTDRPIPDDLNELTIIEIG